MKKKAFAFGAAVLLMAACGASTAAAPAATRATTTNAPATASSATPQHSMSPAEMAAMTASAQPAATTVAVANAPAAATADPVQTNAPITSSAPAPTAITTAAPAQPTAAPTSAPVVSGPATTVNVTLTDAAIKISSATAPTGKVTFLITNSGAVEHEFVVLQTSLPQNAIPVDPTNAALVQEPGLLGKTPSLAPKTSTTLSFSLPAGSYVLICNELAHYMALGMHTAFSVR